MDEDDVERPVAHHLVGDRVPAAALHVADGIDLAARVGDRRGDVQRRVLAQDPSLQLADARRRLEPLLVQHRAEVAIGGQRVGLAAGAVEREHELRPQPLAQRLAAGQRLELAGQVAVAAQRQLGVDPVLEADAPTLLQVRRLRGGERLGELRQR